MRICVECQIYVFQVSIKRAIPAFLQYECDCRKLEKDASDSTFVFRCYLCDT
jgi:hypothetical protein